MTLRIAFITDPLDTFNIKKDSTLMMILEAQRRQWLIHHLHANDIFLRDNDVFATTTLLHATPEKMPWYTLSELRIRRLSDFDVIFMRKDPPFNMQYIYVTYLLEIAEQTGVLMVNKPQSLRDANEKLFTAWFPQCCPEMLVTSQATLIREFANKYHHIVLKPLHSMGGEKVFVTTEKDPNLSVIIETLTDYGQEKIIVQRYIPDISQGDKRILMINGKAIPYALARIPAPGETRGNLAAGATAKAMKLSTHDQWIADQVGPVLRQKGIFFAGLDVIGEYLTEINVTSPTCIQEIERAFPINISQLLFDSVEQALNLD
jgi:glutathione synthase